MKKGDRVRMTERAIEQRLDVPGYHLMEPSSTGVVTSILRPPLIRVLRDNRKTVKTYHIKFWEKDKMDLQKMIDETIAKDDQAARDLPAETKKAFWRAFHDDGLSIGEARRIAGLEVEVAVALIIQCYKTRYIPLEVDEIE